MDPKILQLLQMLLSQGGQQQPQGAPAPNPLEALLASQQQQQNPMSLAASAMLRK